MNADGRKPVNLTNNAALESGAWWSPNGTKILFVSRRDGNAEIYSMDANGANPVNVTSSSGFDTDPALQKEFDYREMRMNYWTLS